MSFDEIKETIKEVNQAVIYINKHDKDDREINFENYDMEIHSEIDRVRYNRRNINNNSCFVSYAKINKFEDEDIGDIEYLLLYNGETPDFDIKGFMPVNYYAPVGKLFSSSIGAKIEDVVFVTRIIHKFDKIQKFQDQIDFINNTVVTKTGEKDFRSSIAFLNNEYDEEKEISDITNEKLKRSEFELSGQYILDSQQDAVMRTEAKNIIIYGQPGTGKTTTAIKIIAKQCYYNADGEIKEQPDSWKMYSFNKILGNYIQSAFALENITINNNLNFWEEDRNFFIDNLLNKKDFESIKNNKNKTSLEITKSYENIDKKLIEYITNKSIILIKDLELLFLSYEQTEKQEQNSVEESIEDKITMLNLLIKYLKQNVNKSQISFLERYNELSDKYMSTLHQKIKYIIEEKEETNNVLTSLHQKFKDTIEEKEKTNLENKIDNLKSKISNLKNKISNLENKINNYLNEDFFDYSRFVKFFNNKFIKEYLFINEYNIDSFLYILIKVAFYNINETNQKDNKINLIKNKRVSKIIVDEASNFSAIQIKTIKLFARDGLILLGDLNQRIKNYGISSWKECYNYDTEYVEFSLNNVYRQNPILIDISNKLIPNKEKGYSVYRKDIEYPRPKKIIVNKNNDDSFYESVVNDVYDIYQKENRIPTICFVVKNNDNKNYVYNKLKQKLQIKKLENILDNQIKILEYENISGLEFEISYLTDIKDLENNYLYVAITRTVQKLNVVCEAEKDIPEKIRSFFVY